MENVKPDNDSCNFHSKYDGSWWDTDAKGIPTARVCNLCINIKRKKFRPEKAAAREGWQDVPAVRHNQIFEIKSADILQPGPAALTDGVAALHRIILQWSRLHA